MGVVILAASCSSKNGADNAGGGGGGFNASQGGAGQYNGNLPPVESTTDGLYGISATDVANLKKAACTGWQAEPEGGGSAIMEFIVDITSSMTEAHSSNPADATSPTKWAVFSQTLPTIFQALPPSFAVGVMYFSAPNIGQCYRQNAADVPISPLNATQLAALDNSATTVRTGGATPTYDAWNQGYQNVTTWTPGANDPPGLQNAARYLVLITDGVPTVGQAPNDCAYLQNGITLAEYDIELGKIQATTQASATSYPPGVKTFVVGVIGSNNPQGAAFDPMYKLSQLAVIGGTAPAGCTPVSGTPAGTDVQPRGTYCHYDLSTSTSLAADLSGALTGIASGLLSCDYTIPAPPAGKTIDPKTTTLVFTDGANGNSSLVLQNTAANCDKGWQFTDSTNTHIHICGVTCNALQQNSMSTLSLTFGCEVGQIIN